MKISFKKILPENYKSVYKSFFALSILQMTNYILPLVTIPYIVRVIGTEKFGLISFAQTIMVFFTVFTDYGFHVTATREISINRKNIRKVSITFSKVLITKLALGFCCFIILLLLVSLIPKFQSEKFVYIIGFTIVIGHMLMPIWFFQGIEKMKYITYLNLVSKFIFTSLIFILIKKPSDYIYILFYHGLGNIVSGTLSLFLVIVIFNVKFKLYKWEKVWSELLDGFSIFLSNISIMTFKSSGIFILGIVSTNQIIGYYSIADKVIQAFWQVLNVFSQAIYPFICKLSIKAHQDLRLFFRNLFTPFIFIIFIGCILIYLNANRIVELISGENIIEASKILRILSAVPFLVALNIPANQTLLVYNFKKSYSITMLMAAFICLILSYILFHLFDFIGIAYATLATTLYITISLHLILKYKYSSHALF